MEQKNHAPTLALTATLGVLTGFDALAIDMYLPAISEIAGSFGVQAAEVQASLSIFLIGLALGQFLLGPIADRYGRRLPLMAGVVLFLAASVWIALSQNLGMFLLGRFFQGLGGAAGIVIPRMIVSERFERREGAKTFALLIQVMMIAPIIAPPLGGVLLGFAGWQSIFWVLAGIAAISLVFALRIVPETLPVARRQPLQLAETLAGYNRLLSDPRFTYAAASGALIMASLFVYIGASAFVFIEHFGLSPQTYSLIFAGASISLVIAGQINNHLLDRIGEERLLSGGLIAHGLALAVLVTGIALGAASLPFVIAMIVLAVAALSFAMGNITAIALDRPAGQAGLAASFFGTAQYAVAGVIGTLSAALQGGHLIVPVATMLICAVLALVTWRMAARQTPSALPARETHQG